MQTGDPKQVRELRYFDLHMLNSSKNALLEPVVETQELDVQTGQWQTVSVAIDQDHRIMVNDGVLVNPETLTLNDPSGVPALTHFRQRFGAEWAAIGGFVEQLGAANGYL
jgi:hypothetical protein